MTGNAAAKPKTGYKRATPARAALKKEIADLKVSGLVVPKKHRTKREKKDTDSYEKSEPSKELGHNSAVTDLKRQSTDLHLSGMYHFLFSFAFSLLANVCGFREERGVRYAVGGTTR